MKRNYEKSANSDNLYRLCTSLFALLLSPFHLFHEQDTHYFKEYILSSGFVAETRTCKSEDFLVNLRYRNAHYRNDHFDKKLKI
jgi:hypothetical protein